LSHSGRRDDSRPPAIPDRSTQQRRGLDSRRSAQRTFILEDRDIHAIASAGILSRMERSREAFHFSALRNWFFIAW
jgi:hypothetical protein